MLGIQLIPTGTGLVVQPDPILRERIELRCKPPFLHWTFAVEIADVEKDNNEVIESSEAFRFDEGYPIAVSLVTALDLDTDLLMGLPRVGVHTNEVISFILWRCLVGKDVPPQKVSDRKILSGKRHDRQLKDLSFPHLSSPFSPQHRDEPPTLEGRLHQFVGAFYSHRAAASSTTSSWSSANSLNSRRLGAGGVSSVMPEKRTGFCRFM